MTAFSWPSRATRFGRNNSSLFQKLKSLVVASDVCRSPRHASRSSADGGRAARSSVAALRAGSSRGNCAAVRRRRGSPRAKTSATDRPLAVRSGIRARNSFRSQRPGASPPNAYPNFPDAASPKMPGDIGVIEHLRDQRPRRRIQARGDDPSTGVNQSAHRRCPDDLPAAGRLPQPHDEDALAVRATRSEGPAALTDVPAVGERRARAGSKCRPGLMAPRFDEERIERRLARDELKTRLSAARISSGTCVRFRYATPSNSTASISPSSTSATNRRIPRQSSPSHAQTCSRGTIPLRYTLAIRSVRFGQRFSMSRRSAERPVAENSLLPRRECANDLRRAAAGGSGGKQAAGREDPESNTAKHSQASRRRQH